MARPSLWHHPLTIIFLPTISEDFQSKMFNLLSPLSVLWIASCCCFCRCYCCCCCHCTALMFIICCPLNIDFLSLLLTHGHKHGYSTTTQHTFVLCIVCTFTLQNYTVLYFGNVCCAYMMQMSKVLHYHPKQFRFESGKIWKNLKNFSKFYENENGFTCLQNN